MLPSHRPTSRAVFAHTSILRYDRGPSRRQFCRERFLGAARKALVGFLASSVASLPGNLLLNLFSGLLGRFDDLVLHFLFLSFQFLFLLFSFFADRFLHFLFLFFPK